MVDFVTELRNKYRKNGYFSLTDKEKIILLLSYSEKCDNVNMSADKISEIYGNLHNAADCDAVFMQKICGISSESAVLINLISQLKRKSNLEFLLFRRHIQYHKRSFCQYLKQKQLSEF